ncbi:MAG: alpha-galactosidase [Kiritimatiellae bacterium]|nr:alpha-galactosidase [Kiritimatiellia bacterium]
MRILCGTILAAATAAASVAAEGAGKACDRWNVFTDFGLFEGAVRQTEKGFAADENGIRVETEEKPGAAGVTHRRTVVRNMGKKPFAATCLLDVFRFEGGDFDVYTQANTWMNESRGAWQPLHTCVEARCGGMRTTYGAAPVLALWDRQAGRGRVFHLMSDAMWEMRAAVVPGGGEKSSVAVEVGMDSRYLRYVLKPGEEAALPEVVYYDFTNKTDLDCHKLHAWWNDRHPCRAMPAIYNTWLCRFDKLDFGFVMKQVEKAAELGLEYFVIDAGWFGAKGDWGSMRGDWKERPDGWLGGRLAEVSKAVRAAGMKFGLWIEAEVAAGASEVFKAHPEYFRRDHGGIFLDFARDDARGHLHSAIDALVEKYGVEFVKFDFNCDAKVDDLCRDFADYNAGYRRFVREVRGRHPGIYLEGCASGGLMMDLGWARDFDSFWLSDNQSPVYGLRIAKETMLRLPPQKIERWITARSAANLQPDYSGNDERLLATEDAWWREMRSVAPDFVAAFAAGGPVGFSCDLTALSEKHAEYFRKMVAERKRDAAFWGKAVSRVLCDSPEVVVLQYSDAALRDVRVVVATGRSRQNSTTVRPVLDAELDYEHNGQRRKGAYWMEHGVAVGTGICDAKKLRFSAAAQGAECPAGN